MTYEKLREVREMMDSGKPTGDIHMFCTWSQYEEMSGMSGKEAHANFDALVNQGRAEDHGDGLLYFYGKTITK